MTAYLQHVKADVVFGFFGYNESFAGVEKADDHRKKPVDFVKKTRGSKANGKSFPRIVLFSPIAHENWMARRMQSSSITSSRCST